jgi:hypothetical protein
MKKNYKLKKKLKLNRIKRAHLLAEKLGHYLLFANPGSHSLCKYWKLYKGVVFKVGEFVPIKVGSIQDILQYLDRLDNLKSFI